MSGRTYDVKSVTYTLDGSVNSDDPYVTTVWLGKDMSSSWPQYGSENFTTTHTNPTHMSAGFGQTYTAYPDSQWENTYYFTGWTEYRGASTASQTNTYNNVAASQAYIGKNLIPDPAQTTYTLQAEYVADSDPEDSMVTVHYMLRKPGATGADHTTDNYYEVPEYEQNVYGITGNPDSYSNAVWEKILSQATPVDGYERENYREARAVNETVYIPLYTYDIPDETYYHRFGNFGNLLYAEIFVGQSAHTGTSTDAGHPRGSGVREGQYSLYYHYLIGRSRYLSNSEGVYQMDPNALFHNSFEVTNVMSVTDLRGILEGSKRRTGWDQVTYKGNHVYLYYEMQSYPLTLMSAETGAALKTATVQYSKYLTDEDGTHGYIREDSGLGYTPPAVPGRSFAFWAVSRESTSPWEGAMPNQPFTLWAHYEDTKVKVTALGVQANGELRRADDAAKTIVRDANDLPASWADDEDYSTNDFVSLTKPYGTRFREFELPIPSLESGEIFYGWKRVENGKMVGSYLSNTQAITGDIVVAPDITVNKGGSVVYYANGATNEGLTTINKYGEDGFLYEEGGYYFGASAKAKIGTFDGSAVTNANPALKKGGFGFICWNAKADGGDSYFPGDSVSLPKSGVVKLYAQYASKREITLVYHINLPADFTSDTEADQDAPGFVKLPLDGAFTLDMVDVGLNGKTDTSGIEEEEREDTHTQEKVLKIVFKDYLEDSSKYPNSQYPSSVDSEGEPFILYCPGHTFLHWNTARDGSDETSLRSDDMRINTLGRDSNGEIHLYAQWESIVLPVQVYEVTPHNLGEQYRLRAVSNTGSANHIDAAGNTSTVTTSAAVWGNPYNSYLKSDTDRGENDTETAVSWYMADVRHGIDPKDSYLKSVLSTNETIQIRYVRFDATANKWQYSSSDATVIDSVPDEDWKDFGLGDELKIFYERPQYMVYFHYNGGIDPDTREYRGEYAEAAFTGTNQTAAELAVISDVTRNGFMLVGWSLRKADGSTGPRADLGKEDPLPTDAYFYKIDEEDASNNDVIPITQSGTGISEIRDCSASGDKGGAVNLYAGKSASFEGNVVIEGNTNTTTDTGHEHNVVLDTNSNTVIRTTNGGLGSDAHIGVFVIPGQFAGHGE